MAFRRLAKEPAGTSPTQLMRPSSFLVDDDLVPTPLGDCSAMLVPYISTKHITQADRDALTRMFENRQPGILAVVHDRSCFAEVQPVGFILRWNTKLSPIEEDFAGLDPGTISILKELDAAGFNYVRFEIGGDELDWVFTHEP